MNTQNCPKKLINYFNAFKNDLVLTCLTIFVTCLFGTHVKAEVKKSLSTPTTYTLSVASAPTALILLAPPKAQAIRDALTQLSGQINAPLTIVNVKNTPQIPIYYVHNYEEFKTHVFLHRKRCLKLAEQLIYNNAIINDFFVNEFGDRIDERERFIKTIIEFISLHDEAKVNESQWFLKWTKYKFTNSVPNILYHHFWHRNLNQNDQIIPELGVSGKDFIKEMNRIDEIVGMNYLKARGFYDADRDQMNRQGLFLKWLEKVVDLVDRGSNPTSSEEFNKVMRKASEMFYTDRSQADMSEFHKQLFDVERQIFGNHIVENIASHTRGQTVAFYQSKVLEAHYKGLTRNLNLPRQTSGNPKYKMCSSVFSL